MAWLNENLAVATWLLVFAALWLGWSLNRLCDLIGAGPSYRAADQINETLVGIREELAELRSRADHTFPDRFPEAFGTMISVLDGIREELEELREAKYPRDN